MKIFHGITGSAGQPRCITNALKKLDIDADAYSVNKSVFGYEADHYIGSDLSSPSYSETLESVSENYDIFHFYFRSFWFQKINLDFPTGLDIALLRAKGKRVIVNFRGSEARIHSLFKEYSPYNYVDENPDNLTSKFPESAQKAFINYVCGTASTVLVPDPELQSYVPNSIIVPRAIDLDKWPDVGIDTGKKELTIIHAPSRRVVKGSEFVFCAIEKLKQEGHKINFKLIENLENHEARELYKDADIVIDQLRIGWYGVLAAECMALGKPVVSYIRDDLVDYFSNGLPLQNATPDNLVDKLRELITNPQLRYEYSRKARAFCEAEHDSVKVAKKLIDVYKLPENDLDISKVNELIRLQQKRIKHLVRSSRGNSAPNFKEVRLGKQLYRDFKLTLREKGLATTLKMAFNKLKRVKVIVLE